MAWQYISSGGRLTIMLTGIAAVGVALAIGLLQWQEAGYHEDRLTITVCKMASGEMVSGVNRWQLYDSDGFQVHISRTVGCKDLPAPPISAERGSDAVTP